MNGNPHFNAANKGGPSLRQTHATLALAHEQRTANLIAWLGLQISMPDLAMDDPTVVEITDRLGAA